MALVRQPGDCGDIKREAVIWKDFIAKAVEDAFELSVSQAEACRGDGVFEVLED